jgi:threonine/homoserine/homoserine lactone efflux protein
MTPFEVTIAILVLLVTPGPTNTLLFLAAADRGWRQSLHLIPAELAGYLTGVIPLMLIGTALLARYPAVEPAITVIAALWVAVLAVRLLHPSKTALAGAEVTARLVFVTTLLNPKALIFGLVLLPGAAAATNLAIFAAEVVLVAAGWAAAGAAFSRRRPGSALLLRRIAAVWLAAISATLMVRGFAA